MWRNWRMLMGAMLCVAAVSGAVPLPRSDVASATDQKFAVSLGGSCAVTDNGEQWCWGPSWDGGLANGTGGGTSYELNPASKPVRSNGAGYESTTGTCAQTTAGAVRCWGSDGVIEDGTGSLFSDPPWGTNVPTDYGFSTATEVAGRCALLAGGTVQCYGWDNWGQVGRGGTGWPGSGYTRPPPSSAVAVGVVGLTDVIDIAAGRWTNCAAKQDGTLWCWGLGREGALGDGLNEYETYTCNGDGTCLDDRYASSPVQVAGITDAVSVYDQCVKHADGSVSCWGKNQGGRFQPSGSETAILTPTKIPAFNGALDVAVGYSAACAVLTDGSVVCQGEGPLGDGTSPTTPTTATLDSFTHGREVVAVGAGYSFCVRSADGTIGCWGRNSDGSLGLGFISDYTSPVLTPGLVIGFGGELPEDDLVVTIAVDPQEVEVPRDGDGAPIPQPVTVTVTINNPTDTDVPSVAVDQTLATTLEVGDTKAITQVDGPTAGEAEIGTIAQQSSETVVYHFEVYGSGVFGIEALVRWADPVTSATETGFAETTVVAEIDDGFEIELTGQATASPVIAEVTAAITNTSDGPIENIIWDGGGLQVDALTATAPMALVSGPFPALPTTLAAGETATVVWRFAVQGAGAMVNGLSAAGTNSLGPVNAFEELSAEINESLIRSLDLQKVAVAGLEDYFRGLSEQMTAANAQTKAEVLSETDQFRQAEYDSYRQLGFGDAAASFLASGATQRKAIENYASAFWEGGAAQIDTLGAEGGENLYKLWALASDPVKREQLANKIVDIGRTEFGYLESGFNDPGSLGAVDLEVAFDAWGSAKDEVVSSAGFALVGQAELYQIMAGEFAADPLKFSTKVGKRHGGQTATVAWYTAQGVVEEVATGGLGPITRGADLVEGGVDALRNGSKTVKATEAGVDASGSATRRFAEAEEYVKRFDDLPYGTQLDYEMLEELGGFAKADVQQIEAFVARVKNDYDVDLELVFRTAEPMSAGIDGVGKRSFTKEKAVGAMDLMLGAPPSLSGKVAIFKPEPLSKTALDALDFDNPGFKDRYQKRLETQQNNWDAFLKGGAKTQRLVEASQELGGITVLDGRPNNPTFGVDYVEQLDQPGFIDGVLADNPGVTREQVEALRTHPSATPANLELDIVDGAYALSDNVRVFDPGSGQWVDTKKPVISDYDGQAVLPADGEWPPGVRSQIETLVKTEMDKIGRSGRHGWSDAANDLPSDLFHLAAEYVLTTTHPGAAKQVARNLERRFRYLSEEFRNKATRFENSLDDLGSEAAKVQRRKEIDRLRSLANKYDEFTVDTMLDKWKPGEKTIVFTPGRISVGSNQGS